MRKKSKPTEEDISECVKFILVGELSIFHTTYEPANMAKCQNETNWLRELFYPDKQNRLKEAKLIADSEDGGYYINPLCFYKGDRTKLTE